MVSLFEVPTPVMGLMGQRRRVRQDPLALLTGASIPVYEQGQFDEGDQRFLDAAIARGEAPAQSQSGVSLSALQNMRPAQSPTQAAAPQRERVSGWRLLDRVLGGQTITEGLDSERARLSAEAMRPQQLADQRRIQALVSNLPPEAQIAYALNPDKLGEGLAAQFSPQVVAAGGIQSVIGQGRQVGSPTFGETGDQTVRRDPITGAVTPVYTRTEPSIQERTAQTVAETGRINATNPIVVGQNATAIDPRTGEAIAQGLVRPDLTSVAPGGQIYATDPSGSTRLVGESTTQRPASAAQLKRADDLELQITQDQTAIDRVSGLLGRIESGDIDINPLANVTAGVRNRLGMSDANSLGIAEVRTTVEALRNSILQDANGVQTEGDAVRALNAILAGINDPRVVAQGFREFLRAKTRVNETRQRQLERLQNGGDNEAAPSISREAAIAEARRRGLIQ